MLGIGIDSETSLVVDKNGLATVMGSKNVYLVLLDHLPEICKPATPLTCSGYKLWLLTPGQTFNLATRPTACGYYLGNVTRGVPDGNYYTAGTLVSCAAPTLSGLTPTSGPAGTTVTLTGNNLMGTTSVTFDGRPAASYTVVSATQLRATVPSDGTTGLVAVSTPGGSAIAGTFTVTPPMKSRDINANGTIDVLDMLELAKAYLSRAGEPRYSTAADLNSDGVVDDLDVSIWLLGF